MKSKTYSALLCVIAALLVQAGSAGLQPAQQATGKVKLLRTPNGGLQPQAALDERGVLHLVYFTGEPQGGDIYYVRREAGNPDAWIRFGGEAGRRERR